MISTMEMLIMAHVPEFPNFVDRETAEKLAKERDAQASTGLETDALKLSSVARATVISKGVAEMAAKTRQREAEILKSLGY